MMRNVIGILLLLVGHWSAAPGAEHVVVIIRPEKPPQQEPPLQRGAVATAPRRDNPKTITEVYEQFWNHPNQVYIDSPSGPKPLLGMDIIQEGGRIYPRIPDPYTYRIMVNPDDYDAYVEYLNWRKAVIRRTRIAMGRVPEIAYDEGIITPEVLAIPVGYETGPDYVAVHNVNALDKDHLGTPYYTAKQAEELGVSVSDIPTFPGPPADIEVYLFWHPRCKFCHDMFRDWVNFAEPLVTAGYKVTGIISAPKPDMVDTNDVVGAIEALVVRFGEKVRAIKNIRDWTGLIESMHITGTPTLIYVDRKKQKIIRKVGPQTFDAMREDFWAITGISAGTWPPQRIDAENGETTAALDGQTPLGGAQ